jgi:hypothetical protein
MRARILLNVNCERAFARYGAHAGVTVDVDCSVENYCRSPHFFLQAFGENRAAGPVVFACPIKFGLSAGEWRL